MVVNAEAAELESPMDSKFSSSKLTGKISENGITLEPWNIVKVSQTFTSMTKVYAKPQTTRIIEPNATMSQQRLDWDNDWENLVDSEPLEFRVYTEVDGENLTVYGWDDMPSCVKFKQNVENGKYTYSNNAADVIYNQKNKYNYVLCTLPGYTWDDLSNFTANDAKPIVSEEVKDSKELVFGVDCGVFRNKLQQRTHIWKSCKDNIRHATAYYCCTCTQRHTHIRRQERKRGYNIHDHRR